MRRKIFGPKREEATGWWRRIHKEELYNRYCSPNIIRMIKSGRMRWAGHVVCVGDRRGAYRGLVARPDGKKPFGRHRCRWEKILRRAWDGEAWTGMLWLWIWRGFGRLRMR